jgi:hypothetical protein
MLHRPPLVPILSQANPVHIVPSNFFRINFNIILQFVSNNIVAGGTKSDNIININVVLER